MQAVVQGTVKDGVIVPEGPLPEGARVEIRLLPLEIPPELQEEFDDWDRASAGTIELVERLAQEGESGEPR